MAALAWEPRVRVLFAAAGRRLTAAAFAAAGRLRTAIALIWQEGRVWPRRGPSVLQKAPHPEVSRMMHANHQILLCPSPPPLSP